MDEPSSVADVILRLRAIDAELPAGDGVAQFNRVYLEVTEHVGGLLDELSGPSPFLDEEMLAELGYEPVGFSSSSAALASFRATPERFHAVLSDEAMPGMTGSELVAEIRRIRADIPIIMMSGYVSAGLTTRAREAGVHEVLSKPLVSRDIARSLAGALRG